MAIRYKFDADRPVDRVRRQAIRGGSLLARWVLSSRSGSSLTKVPNGGVLRSSFERRAQRLTKTVFLWEEWGRVGRMGPYGAAAGLGSFPCFFVNPC